MVLTQEQRINDDFHLAVQMALGHHSKHRQRVLRVVQEEVEQQHRARLLALEVQVRAFESQAV